ncbi:hypothetical protein [Actinokineospora sp.]|uniref:hypothetical protein n=1 Tax=Actinokineospora sp. TaxID=1872133 RepID=UPI00403760DD
MTGFQVDPDALTELSELIARGHDDLSAAETYAYQVEWLDPYTGILEPLQPRVQAAFEALAHYTTRAASITDLAAQAVGAAATKYASVDSGNAAILDFQVPAQPAVPLSELGPFSHHGYEDVTAPPRRHLVEAPGYAEMEWKYALESDLLSVSGAVREVVRRAFDIDIFEPLLGVAAGDWREVRRTADRCVFVGRCCADVAENLDAGRRSSASDWQGNAADGAHAHLAALAAGVASTQVFGEYLGDQLTQLAEGAFGFYQAISGILADLLDIAIDVAIAAGAAAAVSWVPGLNLVAAGSAVGYAAYKIGKIGELAADVYRYYEDLSALIQTIQAGMDILGGGQVAAQGTAALTVPGVDLAPLPDEPYVFPLS